MLTGRSAPGIGFVVFLLSILMVVTVGAVMAIDTPPQRTSDYRNGQLRSYPSEPEERWSLNLSDMRAYDAGATPLVTGTFQDTWLTAERRSALYATFHGYKPLTPNGDRIDWILTTPDLRVPKASINTFSKDGQFPSDHLPVESWIELGR